MFFFGAKREEMLSSEQVKQKMTDGSLLIDVRTPHEYTGGHIPGSRNIPLDELDKRIDAVQPDKSHPLIVYCQSGGRSAAAARLLKSMGRTHVSDFGGIHNWAFGYER